MIIKINKPQDLQGLFDKTTQDADKNGITWAGDLQKGHAHGKGFEGSYVVDEDYITIYVDKKPRLVTKSRIEKAVRDYISLLS